MLHITLEKPDKEIILRVLDPKRVGVFEKELGFTFYAQENNLCHFQKFCFTIIQDN